MLRVSVLLFASYADALGAGRLELSLPAGSSVRDVLRALQGRGGAERLPARPLMAVNEVYADLDDALVSGDEVAVIPPVAGG